MALTCIDGIAHKIAIPVWGQAHPVGVGVTCRAQRLAMGRASGLRVPAIAASREPVTAARSFASADAHSMTAGPFA